MCGLNPLKTVIKIYQTETHQHVSEPKVKSYDYNKNQGQIDGWDDWTAFKLQSHQHTTAVSRKCMESAAASIYSHRWAQTEIQTYLLCTDPVLPSVLVSRWHGRQELPEETTFGGSAHFWRLHCEKTYITINVLCLGHHTWCNDRCKGHLWLWGDPTGGPSAKVTH